MAQANDIGLTLDFSKRPPSMLPTDPTMPNPAAKDPGPYLVWMRTQSAERQAAWAEIEREVEAKYVLDEQSSAIACEE